MRVLNTTEVQTVSGGTWGCLSWLSWCKPKITICLPKPPVCEPVKSGCGTPTPPPEPN